ncbi:MAG: DUF2807 domain-containing protein [Flavobacteriaceae bacterium]|nr:DUF2807 domain-containing protein [Flavobacteriaceae bacterium]
MLKKWMLFLITITLISCNPKDCFESTGNIIQQEIEVASFTKIKVGNEVSLILKQGVTQKVIIETGENLIDAVKVKVIDGRLLMEDTNSCNLTRDYAITKVIVTSPNITEIRSDTSRNISSVGALEYPNLTIFSEDFFEETLVIADFDLTFNNESLIIVANGSSIFKINGTTDKLNVIFSAGSSRFEGENLIANDVFITHKSTNDILINPQNKIEGTIFNLGDIISYSQPPIINVEELYTGKLIFN